MFFFCFDFQKQEYTVDIEADPKGQRNIPATVQPTTEKLFEFTGVPKELRFHHLFPSSCFLLYN